jgi:hypothetical protein
VGQNLISAAALRAQISQIAKYNTAANTFREKYGYLPGDITATAAAQFGFAARGSYGGQGDGNGYLEGMDSNAPNHNGGFDQTGENLMFWVDLSTANLIDAGFTTATATFLPSSPYITGTTIGSYLPTSKIGNGNYVYTFSGGWLDNGGGSNAQNYFGLSLVTGIGQGGCLTCLYSGPGITVQQAQAIDQKTDDGLPTLGRVVAGLLTSNNWAWGNSQGPANVAPPTYSISSSSTTCFDNNNNSANVMHYSIETSNGSGVNCSLIFKMQAGD